MILIHKFVDHIPNEDKLKDGIVYIAIEYGTVIHKCCCGCGKEVVTPLTPTDWKLTYNGESISLYPSIGNWEFECQSHYWIKNNQTEWADNWSKSKINKGRENDEQNKKRYYDSKLEEDKSSLTILQRIKNFWSKIINEI